MLSVMLLSLPLTMAAGASPSPAPIDLRGELSGLSVVSPRRSESLGAELALKLDLPVLNQVLGLTTALIGAMVGEAGPGLQAGRDSWESPFSLQVELFGVKLADSTALDHGLALGGGLGLRWRIVEGWWLDGHAQLSQGGFGVDAATGYEWQVSRAVALGPVAKFVRVGGINTLQAGLNASVGLMIPDTREVPAGAASPAAPGAGGRPHD